MGRKHKLIPQAAVENFDEAKSGYEEPVHTIPVEPTQEEKADISIFFSKLTQKEKDDFTALYTQQTAREYAGTLGISPITAWRRLKDISTKWKKYLSVD